MSPWIFGYLGAAGAGALEPAYFELETFELSSTASTVSWTNLGAYSDYRHLEIRGVFRDDYDFDDAGHNVVLNNKNVNCRSTRHTHFGSGYGTSFETAYNYGLQLLRSNSTLSDRSFGTKYYSFAKILFTDVHSTTKNKSASLWSGQVNTGLTQSMVTAASIERQSTEPLTTITLESPRAFEQFSRFTLYGIKG